MARPQKRQCAYIIQGGSQCRNFAMSGTQYCYQHAHLATAKKGTFLLGIVPQEGETEQEATRRFVVTPPIPKVDAASRGEAMITRAFENTMPRGFAKPFSHVAAISYRVMAPVASKLGFPRFAKKLEKRSVATLVKHLNRVPNVKAEPMLLTGSSAKTADGDRVYTQNMNHYVTLVTVEPHEKISTTQGTKTRTQGVSSFIVDMCGAGLSPQSDNTIGADDIYGSGASLYSSGLTIVPVDDYFSDMTVMWDSAHVADENGKKKQVFSGSEFYDEQEPPLTEEQKRNVERAVWPPIPSNMEPLSEGEREIMARLAMEAGRTRGQMP